MSQALATPSHTARSDPAFQAFVLLRLAFVAAPILFGLDKLLGLTTDWTGYLWSAVPSVLPLSAGQVMLAVGVVEIMAGVLVALRPRIGGVVVAAWLSGIIVNLLLVGDHHDIALRDLGLLLAAVALSRLAVRFPHVGVVGRDAR